MAVTKETRAHISLKHSLDPAMIGRYVAAVVRRDGCSSFSTTESGRAYFKAIKRELGPGWIVRLSGEYVIGVRRAEFQRLTFKATLARLTQVYAKPQAWRDFYVHRRLYLHKASGRYYAPCAGHVPASIESGDNYRRDNPSGVRAWKRGLRRLGRWVARAEKRWPGVVVAAGLDTNANGHSPTWRRRLRDRLGLDGMWDRERPHASVGTHGGGRLIDAIYANVSMSDPHVSQVAPPRGVDHRAVVVTLAF